MVHEILLNCNKCEHYMDLGTFKNNSSVSQGGIPGYKLTNKEELEKFIKHKEISFLKGINNNLKKLGLKKKPSEITFLDFGCGGGEVVLAGKNIYKISNGVNLTTDYYKYILDKLEINDKKFLNLVTDSVDKLDKKYDLVLSWHVLEHFEYPQDFINIIKKVVKEYITIQVPLLCDHGISPNHYNYFTIKSIKKIFEENGFNTLKCYTINNKCLNYFGKLKS